MHRQNPPKPNKVKSKSTNTKKTTNNITKNCLTTPTVTISTLSTPTTPNTSTITTTPHNTHTTKRSFHSTPTTHKYTRLIDASLSLKNHHAKNRAAENIKQLKKTLNSPENIDNPEFQDLLNDSQSKAQRHKSRIERKMRSKDVQHPFSAYNFNVTVIGRPNVGKSSLFNRLTGEKISMVHNSSGVTRDWNHSSASLANLDFQIIDTAGLEEAIIANKSNPNRENDVTFGMAVSADQRSGSSPLVTHRNKKGKSKLAIPKSEMVSNYILGRPLTKELQESMLQLTSNAIRSSDIVIFMIDAKQGVTPQDEYFASWIRKQLHSNSQSEKESLNISNFNKYYSLLAAEIAADLDENYKKDPTKLPLKRLLEESNIDNIESILSGAHTDRHFLRSIHTKPVIVLANKYDYGNLQNAKGLNNRLHNDDTPEEVLIQDFDLLGFDDVVPFSAIHGVGLGELYSKMVFSMSKVLKQWDVYQRKVKFIQDIHRGYEDAVEEQKREENYQARIKQKEENKAKHEERVAANKIKSAEIIAQAEGTIVSDDNPKHALKRKKPLSNELSDGEFSHFAETEGLEKVGNGHHDHHDQLDQLDQLVDENGQNGSPSDDSDNYEYDPAALFPDIDEESMNNGKDKTHNVKFVVCGRPNAGKSTLLNSLLGEKRLLTGPQPGITRDSIKLDYNDPKFPNHHFELIDTAGLKGITQHQHSRFDLVDSAAMQSTLKSIQNANVVALVVDIATGLYGNQGVDPVFASQVQKNFVENVQSSRFDSIYQQAKAKGASDDQLALLKRKHFAEKSAYDDKLTMLVSRVAGCVTKHEMDIARLVADHGKGLLVIANKIDRLKGGQEEVQSVMKGLLALFSMTYAQNKGVTILPVSALQSTNTNQVMRKVAQLYDRWDSRIGTGVLNRWLSALTQLSPPPKVGTHSLSLKYITQTNTRPPTFALFVNRRQDFPVSYERFIRNSLINEFHLQGIPVRLHLRSGKNPYVSTETLSNSDKFHLSNKRQRDEIMRIRQARTGKHNKAIHGKISTKGFKRGTNAMKNDPDFQERQLDQQYGQGVDI
jgi:small GTP-binding protein